MTKLETIVPFFCGFYESFLSSVVDQEIEQHMEEYDKTYEEIEDQLDYRRAELAISQAWLRNFVEETGIKLSFKEIDSPKQYNFTTDRLVADIELEELKRVRKIAEENSDILEGVIKKHFTSYDGFMSFYSNDMDDWNVKETEELDCNEIMTYIEAAVLVEHDREKIYETLNIYGEYHEEAMQVWV
jgi:predicted transcriptional regulator